MSLTCAACGDDIDRGYIVGQPGTIGVVVCRTCRADGWQPALTPDPDTEAAALRARLAEAEVERLRQALADAEARGYARGVADERAATVAHLRAQAEEGGDPWMVYVAGDVERGAHRAEGQPEVADG
jgi:hypothetical protein